MGSIKYKALKQDKNIKVTKIKNLGLIEVFYQRLLSLNTFYLTATSYLVTPGTATAYNPSMFGIAGILASHA